MIRFVKQCMCICFAACFAQQSAAQEICTETEVRTEIILQASPEAVWNLLFDFDAYPTWHPYLSKVEGALKQGSKIKATVINTDSTTSTFSAFILELEPQKVLSWGGSLGWIFSAKHYFIIEPLTPDSVKFIQGEYWHGWFGKAYGKKIYLDVCTKYTTMNLRMQEILSQQE